ncbi:hypothetical protein F5Y05DRAFT_371885 [Hypoxylon sp. FL0543]|nr:hypothetical protein F5Y05DRAFT_371885 [Hypoxylon sp. FL0543]
MELFGWERFRNNISLLLWRLFTECVWCAASIAWSEVVGREAWRDDSSIMRDLGPSNISSPGSSTRPTRPVKHNWTIRASLEEFWWKGKQQFLVGTGFGETKIVGMQLLLS